MMGDIMYVKELTEFKYQLSEKSFEEWQLALPLTDSCVLDGQERKRQQAG